MFVLLSLAISSFVTATTVTIPTQYGEDFFLRFPVEFIDYEQNTVPGTAQLEFFLSERQLVSLENLDDDLIHVGGMRLGHRIVNLGRQGYFVAPQNPLLGMSTSPVSRLMGRSIVPQNGYLVAPTSASAGVFVLDPETPSDYVFGGEIFYTNIETDSMQWQVPMAVRLVVAEGTDVAEFDPENTQFGTCTIRDEQTTDRGGSAGSISPVIVPYQVMLDLGARLHELGVLLFNVGVLGSRLMHFTENFYESLPNIQFIMQTDDQRHVSLVVLEPREYVIQTSPGNYFLRLRALDPTSTIASRTCTIDRSILRKLVIHFDVHNNRIGFGEPLVEL